MPLLEALFKTWFRVSSKSLHSKPYRLHSPIRHIISFERRHIVNQPVSICLSNSKAAMSNPGAIVPTRSCRAQEDFDFAAQWYYRSRRHAAGTVFIFLQMLETSRDTAQQVLQDLGMADPSLSSVVPCTSSYPVTITHCSSIDAFPSWTSVVSYDRGEKVAKEYCS